MSKQDFSKYFNPAATNIEISTQVSVGTAEDSGWEFSDLYEDARRRDSETGEVVESYKAARERIRKEWSIEVDIVGPKEGPTVTYVVKSWHNGNVERGDRQDTGDAEKSIEDVIYWIENDKYENVSDYSYEEEGNTYQPSFAQFNTQA